MNKHYARIEVLKHFVEAATKALEKKGVNVHLEKDATKALKDDNTQGKKKKES